MKPEGVIVPVAVPLDAARRPDPAALGRLVEYLLASGVDGLFANGSMGGFAFHPARVQVETVERICAVNRGRAPLLAGASDTSVARVLERIRSLAHLPVAGFVLLPPYYFVYDQPALVRFFELVADAAPKPVVLYENPRLAHNSLTPESIATLARHPNIAGLKISTADPQVWERLLAPDLPRQRFALIAGAEKLMSTALRMGFDGITGGFHNLFAPQAVALYQAARRGDFAAADEAQALLNRGYRVFELAGGWRGLEIAFRYMGIGDYAAPPPFDVPAPAAVCDEILAILRREGCPIPYPAATEAQS
jgi:4-hydroxy-tetrahydrodipicolinate synthase